MSHSLLVEWFLKEESIASLSLPKNEITDRAYRSTIQCSICYWQLTNKVQGEISDLSGQETHYIASYSLISETTTVWKLTDEKNKTAWAKLCQQSHCKAVLYGQMRLKVAEFVSACRFIAEKRSL